MPVKLHTDSLFNWLSSFQADKLFILNEAKSEEAETEWNTLTVPNPSEYINIDLYFRGHLDNDMVLQGQPLFVPPLGSSTDDLAKTFVNLIAPPKTAMPVYQMVVVDPSKEINTPKEQGDPLQIQSTGETVPPTEEKVEAPKPHDDSDVEMNPAIVDILNLDNIGKKECLQNTDHHKYTSNVMFNPKIFKSGPSIGYINIDIASFELLFAQVRMTMELMFDIIPLSRFNHLLENGGSNV